MKLSDDERRELAAILLESVPSKDGLDHELLTELGYRVDKALSGAAELINVRQSHDKLRAELLAMAR